MIDGWLTLSLGIFITIGGTLVFSLINKILRVTSDPSVTQTAGDASEIGLFIVIAGILTIAVSLQALL